jgi:hypothetical protein
MERGEGQSSVRLKIFIMSKTENFRKKINGDMDQLQALMESNAHLEDPVGVATVLEQCRTYWTFLSEEDQDYIHGATFAIEEQHNWNI